MKTQDREKGLRYATTEGVFATLMSTLCNNFLSPFALALGASNVVIGLLSSAPSVLWAVAQLPAARLAEVVKDRRFLVFVTSLVARLFWLPIILLPFLVVEPLLALIALITISTFIGSFAGPAWAAIMGDLVPGKKRGDYFSKRTYICTAFSLVATFAAGWFLDLFPKGNLTGFLTIFMLGLLCGVLSSVIFNRIPKMRFKTRKINVYKDLKLILRDKKFKNFLLMYFVWQFGLMIAGPFFVVQLLEKLHAPYIWVAILSVVSGVSTLLVLKGWGKLCDKFSHRSVLVVSAFGICLVPLLWVFAASPEEVIPIEILGGAVWAGFNLALFNYLLEASPSGRTHAYTAVFWTVVGVANIAAPFIGGIIADHFANLVYNLKILFVLSFVFRLAAAFLFLKFLEEPVKQVVPTKTILADIKIGLTDSLMRFAKPYNHVISYVFGPKELEEE